MLNKKRIFDLLPEASKVFLGEKACISQAVKAFRDFEWIDTIPIINDRRQPVGVITRSRLFESLVDGISRDCSVCEVMESTFVAVSENLFLKDIIVGKKLESFIAVDSNGKFVGIIQPGALVNAYRAEIKALYNGLNVLIDSAHNGIVVVDSEGIIQILNRSAEKITEIKTRDAIGKNVSEVMPNTRLKQVFLSGVTELVRRQRIGNSMLLINRTPIIEDGRITGAIVVFQDLAEAERAVENLGKARNAINILEHILDYAYESITVIDETEKIIYFNRANLEMLGIDPKVAIGRKISEILPDSRLPTVLKTGVPEIRVSSIKGDNRIVNRIPIKRDGKIVGAMGMVLFKEMADLRELYKKLDFLNSKVGYYRKRLENQWMSRYDISDIIGKSKIVGELKRQIMKIASTDSPVLIKGETGTGKELFAHAIHSMSRRKERPFVRVNCAAIPKELLESELFGYEQGAFTGARRKGMIGKFELANEGTIFLDEISDMPLSMQAEILRVLQEKEVIRVGGTKPLSLDFRLITSTNKSLRQLVEEDKFRADLFYRVEVVTIDLPPLRERKGDIRVLANYLVHKKGCAIGKPFLRISDSVFKIFELHDWPGNIRELSSVIEQAIAFSEGEIIDIENLPDRFLLSSKTSLLSAKKHILKEGKTKTEKQIIANALKIAKGNRTKAARLLGIHRSGLYQKMEKYHIA